MAKRKAKPKIGAYLRVSTTDKQTTIAQRHAIRQWAETSHIPVSEISWYEDRLSGATTNRPQLAKLLRAVAKGRVDCVTVFRLDRLARILRDGLAILHCAHSWTSIAMGQSMHWIWRWSRLR